MTFINKNIIVGVFCGVLIVLLVEKITMPLDQTQLLEALNAVNKITLQQVPFDETLPVKTLAKVQDIITCNNKRLESSVKQRGDFLVFHNYVKAESEFKCYESITYATHGDLRFLDNVVLLVRRWRGPVSLAIYAPGDDFHRVLAAIAYLRHCRSPLILQLVSFHIFLQFSQIPKQLVLVDLYVDNYDCAKESPYANISTFRQNLSYPINVARNIARESATTHFILSSDIELFPSSDLIVKFLTMVATNGSLFERRTRRIFTLPLFEIGAGHQLPSNKTELQELLDAKQAFMFHKNICAACHDFPQSQRWLQTGENGNLGIFAVGKRVNNHKNWEPFYIGTAMEPFFDERLTWEGQSNKMSQGYAMCLLNYDYLVLDNAFLVHKPGIKTKKYQMENHQAEIRDTNDLLKEIKAELDGIYGRRDGCKLGNSKQ